jgi:hypothetical protein
MGDGTFPPPPAHAQSNSVLAKPALKSFLIVRAYKPSARGAMGENPTVASPMLRPRPQITRRRPRSRRVRARPWRRPRARGPCPRA